MTSLAQAQSAGQHGMQISFIAAEKRDPDFAEKAKAAILRHLRDHGACSGEVLTDIAQAYGARCDDARAFGAVFQGLARQGLIRKVGYKARTKGHGAPGPVWSLVV